MVSANELRVGNILADPKFDNQLVEVHTFCRYDYVCKVTEHESGYLYESSLRELEPIPLTPDILLKFGFENENGKSKPDLYWFIKEKYFWIKNTSGGFMLVNGLSRIGILLKYLHQLQNLYFALTGEELILKQPL